MVGWWLKPLIKYWLQSLESFEWALTVPIVIIEDMNKNTISCRNRNKRGVPLYGLSCIKLFSAWHLLPIDYYYVLKKYSDKLEFNYIILENDWKKTWRYRIWSSQNHRFWEQFYNCSYKSQIWGLTIAI